MAPGRHPDARRLPKQKYELVQLRDGRWPGTKNDIGVERMAATFDHLGLGDQRHYSKSGDQEQTYNFTSLIRHPFVPPPMFMDMSFFFMSGKGLERFGIPDGKYDSFFVRVTPYSTEHAKEVATAIKDKLAKQNIRVAAFVYQDPNRHWGRAFMDGFVLVQQMLAVLCVLMSAILVYNTLSNLITQQTDQIGILKAIGGRSGTIVGVYLVSAFVYGILALIIAVPLGAIVAFGVSRILPEPFQYRLQRVPGLTERADLPGAVRAGGTPACRTASDTAGREHDDTASHFQLRVGRRIRLQLARPPCREHRAALAALSLCDRAGKHVPAEGAAADDRAGAGHGGRGLPDGHEFEFIDRPDTRQHLRAQQIRHHPPVCAKREAGARVYTDKRLSGSGQAGTAPGTGRQHVSCQDNW